MSPQTPEGALRRNKMSISDQVSMFYNAKPHIFEKAKILREHMTEAELELWENSEK